MSTSTTDLIPCVLLVEDDPDMRAMLRATLAQCGYGTTIQAANGVEALDVSQGRVLALVICDWQMDLMDGPSFLRALRQRPDAADVPVIMVTANDAGDSGDLARELRISAWLTKPISAARLTERVRAVLGTPMLGTSVRTASAGSPDWSTLTARYQAKLSAEVVTIQEVLATLPYRERDRPAAWLSIERTLHNIKGQAGTFNYGLVTELARRAHELLRSARTNPRAAARCHADIARALGSVANAIQRIAANRLNGDGGEAGLRLLAKLDSLMDPLRATLRE